MQLICKYLTIPLQSMTWMIQGYSRWGRKQASAPPSCEIGKQMGAKTRLYAPENSPGKTAPVTYHSRK